LEGLVGNYVLSEVYINYLCVNVTKNEAYRYLIAGQIDKLQNSTCSELLEGGSQVSDSN